jgi:shikimate dehydrogenase
MALQDSFGISVADKVIFILGCGGAGKPTAVAALLEGASEIVLANRTLEKAQALKEHLLAIKKNSKITVIPSRISEWIKASNASDIIVQATSAGLSEKQKSILPSKAFKKGQYVMDMIYSPPETAFLREAKKACAKTVNGLPMLLFQGVLSFEKWLNKKAPVEVMRQALIKAACTTAASPASHKA